MANKPAAKPKTAVKPAAKAKAVKPAAKTAAKPAAKTAAKPAAKAAPKPKTEKPVSEDTHKFMHVIDYADDKGEYAGSARVDDPRPASIVNQMTQMKNDGLSPTLRIAYSELPKDAAKPSNPLKGSVTTTKKAVKNRKEKGMI
jgi:hypothetical protein